MISDVGFVCRPGMSLGCIDNERVCAAYKNLSVIWGTGGNNNIMDK